MWGKEKMSDIAFIQFRWHAYKFPSQKYKIVEILIVTILILTKH
jgi:hypothetical protein